MPTPDLFLVYRRGTDEPEPFEGTFADLAAQLGVRLRPVLPWREWVSVDGGLSILRLPNADPTIHSEQEATHA